MNKYRQRIEPLGYCECSKSLKIQNALPLIKQLNVSPSFLSASELYHTNVFLLHCLIYHMRKSIPFIECYPNFINALLLVAVLAIQTVSPVRAFQLDPGNALQHDGTGDFVSIPNGVAPSFINTNFTIEALINLASLPSGSNYVILDNFTPGAGFSRGIALRVGNTGDLVYAKGLKAVKRDP